MSDVIRTAYFGGSFDPPHFGHLAVARSALASGRCDEVWLAPALHQPFKLGCRQAPYADRVAMTELLAAGEAHCQVSRIEEVLALDPSYTFDVLKRCAERYPERRFLLLIGGDSLRDLGKWHAASELVREFEVLTYPRAGVTPTLEELHQTWPAETAQKLHDGILSGDFFQFSSSKWRNDVAISANWSHINKKSYFSDAVRQYIVQKNLYR